MLGIQLKGIHGANCSLWISPAFFLLLFSSCWFCNITHWSISCSPFSLASIVTFHIWQAPLQYTYCNWLGTPDPKNPKKSQGSTRSLITAFSSVANRSHFVTSKVIVLEDRIKSVEKFCNTDDIIYDVMHEIVQNWKANFCFMGQMKESTFNCPAC